jgi:RIO kinase 1
MDDELDRYWLEYGEDEREPRRPRKAPHATGVEELTETPENAEEFHTTYQPSRFEHGWLFSSLSPFYQQNLIHDVLYHVKGGKEASVYCCAAHPATGRELVAVKVYRPRQFRNLRNDKMYREGRPLLTADGNVAKRTDTRLMRAVGKKTEFGLQVQHTSWLMYEYKTLERLFQEGAAVPQPIGAGENAIVMGFQGDAQRAAPTLSEVSLEPDEAASLFQEALRNVELMLRLDVIHGDLSAYNMLHWEGKITVIDFPQVSSVETNSQARFILQRDITRTCEYFQRQGVDCEPEAILNRLWQRYAESRVKPLPDLPE